MNKLPDTHAITPLYDLTEAILKKRSDLALFLSKDTATYQEYEANQPSLSELAHRAFLPHIIWSDLLEYRWTRLAGMFCLFATSHGVTHLALPPFGAGAILDATALAFAHIARLNPPHIPSRMDNVDEQTALLLKKGGYHIEPASPDYLYQREEIVKLSGNKFRAHRASVNQADRVKPHLRPFFEEDIEICLTLYDRWAMSKDRASLDAMMKEDAKLAHHAVMRRLRELGLIGRVVEVSETLSGYTFGFPLSSDTFCVLLEIADHSIRGLSAWLFQAFCLELDTYTYINTMDDSMLARLALTKRRWHPTRLIPSYTMTLT
jgi:hypothetical protein